MPGTPGELVVTQLHLRCQTCDKPWLGVGQNYTSVREEALGESWSDETGKWQCPEHKPNPETHRRY